MLRSVRALTTLCSIAFPLALTAQADVIVVDDDNLPGVDFNDLRPAVNAANPGDTILVFPGSYALDGVNVVVDKALSIFGPDAAQPTPDAVLNARLVVDQLPQGETVYVANIYCSPGVDVTECGGIVLTDQLVSGRFFVRNSTDVRLQRTVIYRTLQVEDSRVELSDCSVWGVTGTDGGKFDGGHGSPAIVGLGASQLRLANCFALGGSGGNSFFFTGGDGAEALYVDPNCQAWISGPDSTLRGGTGGFGPLEPDDGQSGDAIFNRGMVRVSGTDLFPGRSTFPGVAINNQGGTVHQPPIVDPSLAVMGDVTPLSIVTFRVHGPAGADATLFLGRFHEIQPAPGFLGDLLTTIQRSYPLGTIGAQGYIDFAFPLPAHFGTGFHFAAQGAVSLPGGDRRLANSGLVLVR